MKRTVVFGLFLAVALVLAPLASLAPSAEAGSPSYSGGYYCKYHWVKPGETLSGIARWYGVNMWKLAQINGIYNPNLIFAGQKLVIYCHTPKPPPPPPPPPKPPPPKPPPYYPPPPQPGDPQPACPIQPVQGFGHVWYNNAQVRQNLGCPTTPEQGFTGAQQAFHSGFVIQVDTTGTIYVLFKDGHWEQHPNTWHPGDPVNNPYLTPPAGWYQPEYGIGKLWRNYDNMSQRLGWARYPQQGTAGTMQPYNGGMMLWTQSSGVWVLYNNGTYQRFQ
jgi:hypothetical protein